MDRLKIYAVPQGAMKNQDFRVRLRTRGGTWQEAECYKVRIEMHHVSEASLVYFDFSGGVECEVTSLREHIHSAEIRPASKRIRFRQKEDTISFFLTEPAKLSIEINGDRFRNLHLMAGDDKICIASRKEDDKRICLEGGKLIRPEEMWALEQENEIGRAHV